MKKILSLGKVDGYGNGRRSCEATFEWELEDSKQGPKFTMCANVWNPRHTHIIMGGQCCEEVAKLVMQAGSTRKVSHTRIESMVAVWKRWHLNDMHAGCEHQRANWDTRKEITLTHYTWSPNYHDWRKRAADGKLSVEHYDEFKRLPDVTRITMDHKYPEHPEIQQLVFGDWIKIEKTEKRIANWVNPNEHPDGLLGKPCEVCGYKYGTQWLCEAIPADVLAEIRSW